METKMIVGIGTDIVEIERVKKACLREGFLTRCFTDREKEIINKRQSSAAGNFAVKEAVAKALGTGFTGFGPSDIEVLRNEAGAPYVILYNKAKEIADSLNIGSIIVSISDEKSMAAAFAVAQTEKMD